ncbi:hypothetical protein D3C85_1503850 [compost metagenome]
MAKTVIAVAGHARQHVYGQLLPVVVVHILPHVADAVLRRMRRLAPPDQLLNARKQLAQRCIQQGRLVSAPQIKKLLDPQQQLQNRFVIIVVVDAAETI